MYAKTSWPKAWADGDPRCSTSDSSSWRYSFILAGGIIGKARSIQTNPEFTKWQGLQTEGVSITFKYLALRPLAIIEPSKSLLWDLLPHVLKMEVHYWYKLFVHCVENDFESTIVWRSTIHVSTKSIHSHFYLGHVEHAAMNQMVGMTLYPGSSHGAAFARIIYKVLSSSLSSSSSAYSHLEVHHDMQGRRPRESSRLVD